MKTCKKLFILGLLIGAIDSTFNSLNFFVKCSVGCSKIVDYVFSSNITADLNWHLFKFLIKISNEVLAYPLLIFSVAIVCGITGGIIGCIIQFVKNKSIK